MNGIQNLRKWYPSLRPEMEFRCFVSNQLLLGVSQREVTGYHPVLVEKKDDLERAIYKFFTEKVKLGFELENYTFDVYVTGDGVVKLLDFNPWGASTSAVLFDWEDFEEMIEEENGLEIRIVENQCGVRPGVKTAVPYDYLDTSEGSGWDQFLRSAGEELQRQTMGYDAGV